METVSIVGIGRAGGALAIALDRVGVPIHKLIYRSAPPVGTWVDHKKVARFESLTTVDSDILIVATRDPDIHLTVEALARLVRVPPVALHLSGSLSSDELSKLKERNVAIGSMHPLLSISEPELGSQGFSDAYFCVEGDLAAVDAARSLIERLGGKWFSIEARWKPLYHASAVMASGNVTALFDSAIEMLSKCGLEHNEAHRILLPLLQSTVSNLAERSTKQSLTGPFVRGDVDALERHLDAFEGPISDDIRSIYLDLAERSVRLAGGEHMSGMLAAITMAKRKSGC